MEKKNRIFKIILIITLMLFTTCLVSKEFQNDTFFTITVGNKILNQGFYTEETFTWHEGLHFANIKWLFDITIALIHNIFGFAGIYIFVIIISILIAFSVYYIFRKREHNIITSFFMSLFAIYYLSNGLAARAQLVSYLIMIWEYIFINKLLKTNKKIYSLILILLGVLMANVHGPLFPMYIVIFVPYLAEIIIGKIKIFNQNEEESKIIIEKHNSTKLFIITMILSSVCGFITPLKNTLAYTDMFKTIGSIANNMVGELQPIPIIYKVQFYTTIFLGFGILGFTKTKIRLSDAFFILGYGLLSFANSRNELYFAIFGTISLTRLVDDCLKEYKIYDIKINNKIKYTILIFILTMLILFSIKKLILQLNSRYLNTEKFCPEGAINYLIENYDLKKIRLYNGFNEGAYIEYRGILAFMDSRAEIYVKEFNDTEILEDYSYLISMSKHYNEIFDKYNITHVLINEKKLITYMKQDKNWKIVYQDDEYSLFERTSWSI